MAKQNLFKDFLIFLIILCVEVSCVGWNALCPNTLGKDISKGLVSLQQNQIILK